MAPPSRSTLLRTGTLEPLVVQRLRDPTQPAALSGHSENPADDLSFVLVFDAAYAIGLPNVSVAKTPAAHGQARLRFAAERVISPDARLIPFNLVCHRLQRQPGFFDRCVQGALTVVQE
jgi:hypothetical protein